MPARNALRATLALGALMILLVPFRGEGGTPVSVMLQWVPQAQFAGFYVAQDQGFYARRGLDVRLEHGGPHRDSAQALEEGEADFATLFLATALVHRDRGVPLMNVAQIVQRSSLVIVGREDRGVRSPRDLAGRRVSLWGEAFEAPYRAFFALVGISVDAVPQHRSVNLFLRGGVDACCAMYYNEYHAIWQAGLDEDQIEPFFLRDWGIDFPEDGLYARASTVALSPDVARNLAEGTLEGWRFALKSPDVALDSVMRRVQEGGAPTNRPHMAWMLTHILPAIFPDDGGPDLPGKLSREAYIRTARILERHGIIRRIDPFESFTLDGVSRVP